MTIAKVYPPFEGRQESWGGALRSFRQLHGRQDRPNIWEIWVHGDRYFTRHGLLGGAMQNTDKQGKLKNAGKVNQISPETDALAEARRLCRKKWDFEGYDEFDIDSEVNMDGRSGKPAIPTLLKALPGNFALYKPDNNLLESPKLLKKANEGSAVYALKRNGMAVWVVVDGDRNIQIYSRRNRPWHKDEGPTEREDGTLDHSTVIPLSSRYPHLVDSVKRMQLPPNTMLACELMNMQGDTKAHFAHVQSVEKSLSHAAIEKQAAEGWLGLYCWDIPFYGGEDLVSEYSVKYRYSIIASVCHQAGFNSYVHPVQFCNFTNTEAAILWAKQHDFEGWVVVDPEGIYGDKGWNMKGKPDRPGAFCAKLKPWFEDDFVAMWDPAFKVGTRGKGKHEAEKLVDLPSGEKVRHGGVGSLGLYQYNSKGELIYICDCSSGMDFEFQAKLNKHSFPFVVEVKYVDRSYISDEDDTNALTFPGFVRVRTDKSPQECINAKLDVG